MDEPDDGLPGLADALNHLFTTVLRPDGKGLWTNEQASRALVGAGYNVTGQYIGQMRLGRRTNPTSRNLGGIAALFGVPVDYFHSESSRAQTDSDLRLLTSLHAAGIEGLGHELGLSAAGIALVVDFADQLRRYEATARIRHR